MLQDALGIRPDVTVLNVGLLTIQEYRNSVFKRLNIPELLVEYKSKPFNETQKEITDHIIRNKPVELPLYTSTPAWKQFKEYDENLYIVGLVMEYSEENLDNIALLKNNFDNNYALDYIHNQFNFDISHGIVNTSNVNYLPGIIKLFQHYLLSGEKDKAEEIKELGLLIAEKGGDDWKQKAIEVFE
jgi:hypothetical protein